MGATLVGSTKKGRVFPTSPWLQRKGGPTLWLPSAAGRSFSTASPPSPLAPQSGPKVASGDGELDFSSGGGSGVSSFPPEGKGNYQDSKAKNWKAFKTI